MPQTLSAFSSYISWLHKSYYTYLKIFIFQPLALTILPRQKAACNWVWFIKNRGVTL